MRQQCLQGGPVVVALPLIPPWKGPESSLNPRYQRETSAASSLLLRLMMTALARPALLRAKAVVKQALAFPKVWLTPLNYLY